MKHLFIRVGLAICVWGPWGARAVDGVIEISDAVVISEPGSYILTSDITSANDTLDIRGSNVVVNLNGMTVSTTSATRYAIRIAIANGVRVHNGIAQGATAVFMQQSSKVELENLILRGTRDRNVIYAGDCSELLFRNLRVHPVEDTTQAAIAVQDGHTGLIDDCVVRIENPDATTGVGINVYGTSGKYSEGWEVINCRVAGLGRGIYFGNNTTNVMARGCSIQGAGNTTTFGGGGIHSRAVNVRILDNQVDRGHYGILAIVGGDVVILGNRITRSAHSVMFLGAADVRYGRNEFVEYGTLIGSGSATDLGDNRTSP